MPYTKDSERFGTDNLQRALSKADALFMPLRAPAAHGPRHEHRVMSEERVPSQVPAPCFSPDTELQKHSILCIRV